MKKRFIPLCALISVFLLACANSCSIDKDNSDSGNQIPSESSSGGDISSSDPLLVLNLPQTFTYKEIEYNFVPQVEQVEFDENELVAILINPEDEEKFISENHDCDYVVVGSIYNYYDENNRLYAYKYGEYEISEYLVVNTKMISVLFKGKANSDIPLHIQK